MATTRRRLDAELVRRGLAGGRAEARALVESGRVLLDGAPAAKATTMVTAEQPVRVAEGGPRWASRAGVKLAGAVDELAVDVAGRHCLDAGASTGGFTDVLLARGAARVVAVDVGYGQLVWRLREDPRVLVRDRTNVRHLVPGDLPDPPPQLVVADLSFISLTVVLPALVAVADPSADLLLMVKPQFEAGPGGVDRSGVVRDPAVWRDALGRVVAAGAVLGLGVAGAAPSVLPGPSGNREFFVWLVVGATGDRALLDQAVTRATGPSTADPHESGRTQGYSG